MGDVFNDFPQMITHFPVDKVLYVVDAWQYIIVFKLILVIGCFDGVFELWEFVHVDVFQLEKTHFF